MDRKVINKEQFRKMVIEEAKKFISDDKSLAEEKTSRKVTFDKVESLISEMKSINKSISSIIEESSESIVVNSEIEKMTDPGAMWSPNKDRDLDPIKHNEKKNIMHVNENEKDKWNRMLKYEVPSDEQR